MASVLLLSLIHISKSNALYTAYEAAKKDAQSRMAEPVPLVLRNAPTRLMRELDYGKGYQYAHNAEDHLTNMQCLPDSLADRTYYHPTDQGLEPRFQARLEMCIRDRDHRGGGTLYAGGQAPVSDGSWYPQQYYRRGGSRC